MAQGTEYLITGSRIGVWDDGPGKSIVFKKTPDGAFHDHESD